MIKILVLSIFIATLNFLSLYAKPKSLRVYPEKVLLKSQNETSNFIFQGTFLEGENRDLSHEVKVEIKPKGIIRVNKYKIIPIKNGRADILLSYKNQTKTVKVTVQGVKQYQNILFSQDVIPLLTKAGCNTGGCHGSSRGQDGFHLSLFGYDPKGDYHEITRKFNGRRINLANPAKSLLLTKAIGAVQHTGGDLIKKGDAVYQKLSEWISKGAKADPPKTKIPISLEVFPKHLILKGKNKKHRIIARAKYADGSYRDVSELCQYISTNPRKVTVNNNGFVSSIQGGESFIQVRMATLTAGFSTVVIPDEKKTITKLAVSNEIDKHINAKLYQLRIRPTKRSDDYTFIRRAYLDIIGSLPTIEEIKGFVTDQNKDKREKLIEKLVQDPSFVDIWVMKWAELLQIRSSNMNNFSYKSTLLYHTWLKQQFKKGRPIDKIVYDILTSKGTTFSTPQTNYYQIETDTIKISENVAQVFMGTRLQCAQCHNHPFDRWTMDDYYGFAAFFARVGRKKGNDPRERTIFERNSGEINHPVSKKAMPPKFLGGPVPKLKKEFRREVLAKWLVAPENPYFAKNIANMIWAQLMGRGIVEPVDDQRLTNPPSHPQLLDLLTKKLIDFKFDFRKLVTFICNSEAYQRTWYTGKDEPEASLFASYKVKRLRSEILLDAISKVTAVDSKYAGLPLGAKAVHIADGNTSNFFLKTFGRAI